MKVIHLTPGPIFSAGANIGALQLHNALLEHTGLKSLFLSVNSSSPQSNVNCYSYSDPFILLPFLKLVSFLDSLPFRFRNERFRWGLSGSLCLILHLIKDRSCILHFHNLPSTLNLFFLYILPNPKVFTVRDHWIFTGGCRITNDFSCTGFYDHCYRCPAARNNPFLQSMVRFFYKLKRHILLTRKTHVVFNTRSSFEHLLGGYSQSTIPIKSSIIGNIIDVSMFKPDVDRQHHLRKIFAIGKTDIVILAGAADLSDPNKGFHYLSNALSRLSISNVHFCYFGAQLPKELTSSIKIPLHYLGVSTSFALTSDFYKIADIFVMPSIHETFGKTLAEAMSSSLLCIGFQVPGTCDLIHHGQSGYLVPAFSSDDLLNTLQYCIYSIGSKRNSLIRSNARASIASRFSPSTISAQYASVYAKLLSHVNCWEP